MEYEKKICPLVDIDGVIESGTQYDLDIELPDDNRVVIYGIVKNKYKDPIKDAVVKLIEVIYKHGKEERRPVSHTFTDCDGQFVFGPLCPNRYYAIEIWVDKVKHCKICKVCKHEGSCLKGIDIDCDKPSLPMPPKCKTDKDEKDYKEEKDFIEKNPIS